MFGLKTFPGMERCHLVIELICLGHHESGEGDVVTMDCLGMTIGAIGAIGTRWKTTSSSAVCSGLLIGDDLLLSLKLDILLGVVMDVKTKPRRINVTVAPDEKSAEDRLCKDVQDTVEGGLRVRRNHIATLADTPGDGVQSPQHGGQGSALEESLADICAHGVGVPAGFPGELIEDVEEGDAAEYEEAPFVSRPDECADEAGDDHDPVDEDHEHDRRPRHAGCEHQVKQQERCGNEPINVASKND